MKKHAELIAFALLIIGTLGLLANETIFDISHMANLRILPLSDAATPGLL